MLHRHDSRKFPEGFLWGTALSSYQHEGGNVLSDWHEWEQVPGRVHDGTVCGDSVDHYTHYEEDFDLIEKMGGNAHRLSVEWSRIEPEEGVFDEEALAHYRKMLESLKKRKLKIMLTVWHFSLPKWFADTGGWTRSDAVDRYLRYTRVVAEHLGDLVDFWNTMNEPNVYLSQGYLSGAWPPQKKSHRLTIKVGLRLAEAHRKAYRLLHDMLDLPNGERDAQVGIAHNVMSFETYRVHKIIDYITVRALDYWWNHAVISMSRGTHDFLGLNYYFHARLKKFSWPPTTFFAEVRRERRDVSDIGWEVNPSGLFRVLKDFEKYRLPIYITENGLATTVDDRRKRFLVGYLKELYHAIHSGVDVRGYFFWSLLDNFEWEKGYAAPFGLVAVDRKTMKRTPKGSYDVYRHICQENGIPHEMLRYIGHAVDQEYHPLKTGLHAHGKKKK